MTKSELRERHENFRRDLEVLQKGEPQTVVDCMVVQNINHGECSLKNIARKLNLSKARLLAAITKNAFNIEDDNIALL